MMVDISQSDDTETQLEVAIYSFYKWKAAKLSQVVDELEVATTLVHDDVLHSNHEKNKNITVSNDVDDDKQEESNMTSTATESKKNEVNTIATSTDSESTMKLMYLKYKRIIDAIEEEFPDFRTSVHVEDDTRLRTDPKLRHRFFEYPKIYHDLCNLQANQFCNRQERELISCNDDVLQQLKQQREQVQSLVQQQQQILLQHQAWQTENVMQHQLKVHNRVDTAGEVDERNSRKRRYHDTRTKSITRREGRDRSTSLTPNTDSAKKSQRTPNERVKKRGSNQAKLIDHAMKDDYKSDIRESESDDEKIAVLFSNSEDESVRDSDHIIEVENLQRKKKRQRHWNLEATDSNFPESFKERVDLLKCFYKKYMHVAPKTGTGHDFLRRWITRLKKCYTESRNTVNPEEFLLRYRFTPKRVDQLRKVRCFKWLSEESEKIASEKAATDNSDIIVFEGYDPLRFPKSYDGRLGILKQFYELTGHCFVPRRFKLLSNFVNRIRGEYRRCQDVSIVQLNFTAFFSFQFLSQAHLCSFLFVSIQNPQLLERDDVSLRQDQLNHARIEVLRELDFPFVATTKTRYDNILVGTAKLQQIDPEDSIELNTGSTENQDDEET